MADAVPVAPTVEPRPPSRSAVTMRYEKERSAGKTPKSNPANRLMASVKRSTLG